MTSGKNVVGFCGIENYEIILYLARILERLRRKVLLADYSSVGDLTSCIPIPAEIDICSETVTYLGFEFTKKNMSADLIKDYDDILINFGFDYTDDEATKACTSIVYATDQQKHNIEKISSIPCKGTEVPKYLLIKDAVDSKINRTYILDKLQKNIDSQKVYIFDQDIIDKKYKLLAQYDTIFEFRRITGGIKIYLKDMIRYLCTNITEEDLKKAYKTAERGK